MCIGGCLLRSAKLRTQRNGHSKKKKAALSPAIAIAHRTPRRGQGRRKSGGMGVSERRDGCERGGSGVMGFARRVGGSTTNQGVLTAWLEEEETALSISSSDENS